MTVITPEEITGDTGEHIITLPCDSFTTNGVDQNCATCGFGEDKHIADIGEYCIECRAYVGSSSKWFASRKPVIKDGLKGFYCEPCQPLDGTLMEPIIKALSERRFDERMIRSRMKSVGQEELFEGVIGPMLDMLEVILQLERS